MYLRFNSGDGGNKAVDKTQKSLRAHHLFLCSPQIDHSSSQLHSGQQVSNQVTVFKLNIESSLFSH